MNSRGISGSTLKLIAIVTMLIDHIGAAIFWRLLVSGEQSPVIYQTYTAMRTIGRIAFPIFCFLLVEGYEHTRDKRKYAMRMFAFALVSEIPFDLAFMGEVLEFGHQNVYFTLCIGLITIMGFEAVQQKTEWHPLLRTAVLAAVTIAGFGVAAALRTDYDATGVMCILLLYLFRKTRGLQILVGCLAFAWELPALVGFIPIAFYNGKRGWNIKYIFYLFYPVHLLLLYLVCLGMGIAGNPGM